MADAGPLLLGDPPKLGEYELVGRLGEGGQGVVYLGRHPDGREVAVKLLRAQLTKDKDARSRFVRELEVIERVAGFCTAQVLDSDVVGDQPYIVSEYVRGPSLQELVEQRGPRTGTDLERLAIGIATALTAIHQAGVVHRDLKPPNVLIGPDGPRVIDFGIARALDTGATMASGVVGTPAYMAPEQVSGDRVDTPVDLFAWGATMAYAATGRKPFNGATVPVVINQVLNGEPDLDGVPAPLRELIQACMAKDPAQRPTAQEALLALLGATGNGRPTGSSHVPILSQGEALATSVGPAAHASTGPAPAQQYGPSGPQQTGPTGPQPYGHPSQQQAPYGPQGFQTPPPAGPPTEPNTLPPGAPHGPYQAPAPETVRELPAQPGKRPSKALPIAVAAAAVLVIAGAGVLAHMANSGSSSPNGHPSSSQSPSAGSDGGIQPVQAPTDALEALGAAKSSLPIVFSYNYQHLSGDQSAADAKLTPNLRSSYDQTFNQSKTGYLKDKVVQQTALENAGIIATVPNSVKILAVIRELKTVNGQPGKVLKHVRLTMTKPTDTWLINSMEELDKTSPPSSTPGATWPGAGAQTVLKAAQDCETSTTNYDYQHLDTLQANMNKCATGAYLRDFDNQLGDVRQKAPVTQFRSTESVIETAIEDVPSGDTVNVLMTVFQHTTSTTKTTDEFKTLKISMQNINGKWLEASSEWNSINNTPAS